MAIVLARVDDRLLHGQVVVAWRRYLAFDTGYVVDDLVAGDPYLVEVLRLAAPAGLKVNVLTVQEAAAVLLTLPVGQILLLFKRPQSALALVEAGVFLAQLNVGNLASGPGRKRVLRSVSLSEEDAIALDLLTSHGVQVTFQGTPNDRAVAWKTVRQKMDRAE